MRRRFMWQYVGKGYKKAAAAVTLYFVTFTKKALGFRPTSCKDKIMLLASNAPIMAIVIIHVNFILAVIVTMFMWNLVPALLYYYSSYKRFSHVKPYHAILSCYHLKKGGGGVGVKEEELYSKRSSRYLPLSVSFSLFFHPFFSH